jgi:hypothetical protein
VLLMPWRALGWVGLGLVYYVHCRGTQARPKTFRAFVWVGGFESKANGSCRGVDVA